MTSPTDDWLDKQPKITRDEGINALRQVRENIEQSLTMASQRMVKDRHTIQALKARIAELEAQIEQNNEDYDHIVEKWRESERLADVMRDRLDAHAQDRLHGKARYHADDTDQLQLVTTAVVDLVHVAAARTHNVMRLAAAANHHLHHGRIAIAQALLTPLIEGKHDAHRYDEAAGNSREARPEPDNKDHGDNGPAWRVPEGWAQVESD